VVQFCPGSVILPDGVIVADGSTCDLLADEATMKAHRLGAAARVRSQFNAAARPEPNRLNAD